MKTQRQTIVISMQNDDVIVKRIVPIQGRQVMLDCDLAELYGVETKQLKRQVKRNIRRSPADFMIELSERNMKNLRCQIGTSINCLGRRLTTYTTRDAKEIAKLLAVVP